MMTASHESFDISGKKAVITLGYSIRQAVRPRRRPIVEVSLVGAPYIYIYTPQCTLIHALTGLLMKARRFPSCVKLPFFA